MSRARATTVDEPVAVRGVAVDGAAHGGWVPDADERVDRLESLVASLLEADLSTFSDVDRITVVPDAHYPFHPSSGVVTDPAVVAAIVRVLEDRTDADLAIAGVSDEVIGFDRTAAHLGYTSLLERVDAELVDLAEDARTDRLLETGGRTTTVSIPDRLATGATIVVPSLRPTAEGPIAGGMRTLARFATGAVDPDRAALGATRAVDPALCVLDATTAYAGTSAATNALFAGPTASVDALGSSLLERSFAADGALSQAFDERTSISVDSVGGGKLALETIRDRLDSGELPPRESTHPAVTAAYRLYAAVAGDAVPPQLEGEPR
ncbi:DUF362 domain-containing protein [Natrarchaeobaculum sulfurireducens]|uniref:DUF362 domain-containing protein n=1 Tax=Natrarchaeobaculum sulfurireducens TaxID=2044521 RepID=A0A346PGN9_9EURY|nr:DUF362 domain-containing protein [Natrarchaeobaculum sulfurireducens]AXR78684.1 hypothetical protein AArc1_2369 [Natrarchaeobaculum sulfurireducens]